MTLVATCSSKRTDNPTSRLTRGTLVRIHQPLKIFPAMATGVTERAFGKLVILLTC